MREERIASWFCISPTPNLTSHQCCTGAALAAGRHTGTVSWPARCCSAWLRLTQSKLWSLSCNKYLRLLRCIRILSNLLHICYITSLLLSPYSDTWYAKSYFVPLLCNTSVVSVIVRVKGGSPSFIPIIIHYQNNIAHLELLNKQKNLPRALMPLLMPCFHNYHKAELEIKPISSIRDQNSEKSCWFMF